MIKQIRKCGAMTILMTTFALSIIAVSEGSNKTTQNSTLNEQQTTTTIAIVEEETTLVASPVIKPADTLLMGNPLDKETESTTEETTIIEETTIEQTTEDINNLFNQLSDEDWEYLYRTARCEAGNWCKTYNECGNCSECARAKQGQKNVVYVILNRLHSSKFPNNVTDIIFAPKQFSVTKLNKFYTVELTDYLKANVQEAVRDYEEGVSAQGALYFNSISKDYWKSWAEFIFEDEVGHYFFREK